MIDKKTSTRGDTVRVTFELPGEAAQESVAVVGDFNGWSEDQHKMKYVKSRDVWSTKITLKSGDAYQFRYLVDGNQWRNDDQADGVEQSPYASENSVLRL